MHREKGQNKNFCSQGFPCLPFWAPVAQPSHQTTGTSKVDMCTKCGIFSFVLYNYEPPVAARVGGDGGGIIIRLPATNRSSNHEWLDIFRNTWTHFHLFWLWQNQVFFFSRRCGDISIHCRGVKIVCFVKKSCGYFQPKQTANISAFYFQVKQLTVWSIKSHEN